MLSETAESIYVKEAVAMFLNILGHNLEYIFIALQICPTIVILSRV